jgi:hypothetical protein
LRAALPPAPCEHGDYRDDPNLQDEPEERGDAAKSTQQAVAEQHPKKAGAEEAGGEPAE